MAGETISITQHGAVAGESCTKAIQKCIDQVSASGGGTVLIPEGTWRSATIILKSGVTLFVSPNAILKDNGILAEHPEIDNGMDKGHTGPGNSGGKGDIEKHFFIHASDAINVTITGGGTIDGSGPAYWDMDNVAQSGWIPTKRPRVCPMFDFTNCKRLVISDIKIIDSPGWTIHPYCCDDVVIDNIRIENNLFGPNTDGIDINGCTDVFITNCKLTCGDDCIIIKAARNAKMTERVLVSNCVVSTNCIGIGIGQEVESGVRDVVVSNCVFHHAQRMFSIGLWNGGLVENVTVTGCTGDTLETFPLPRPIHIETKRHAAHDDAGLGMIRNVQISNFVARTEGRNIIVAEKPGYIENIVLRDVTMDMKFLEDAEKLTPESPLNGSSQYANRNLEARKQNAIFIAENIKDLVIENPRIQWPTGEDKGQDIPYAAIWARNIDGASIQTRGLTANAGKTLTQYENVTPYA